MLGMKVLQSLHGHLAGIQFLISVLKESMSPSCFRLSGTKFQILGPQFFMLSEP